MMTAVMTTLMPFHEDIMSVFCTDNTTNNIQFSLLLPLLLEGGPLNQLRAWGALSGVWGEATAEN